MVSPRDRIAVARHLARYLEVYAVAGALVCAGLVAFGAFVGFAICP